jgi:uncharacterized protein (TIGR01244 family)
MREARRASAEERTDVDKTGLRPRQWRRYTVSSWSRKQAGEFAAPNTVSRNKQAQGVQETGMADIRRVTDGFSVSPQLALEDFPQLAAMGFRHVIGNRPDGEGMGQPTSQAVEQAATAAGMTYVHAPFAGQPTAEAVEAVTDSLAAAKGPVIAFCRSGTRSVTAWAYSRAKAGALTPEAIINAAGNAGYDLSPLKDLLRKLAAG